MKNFDDFLKSLPADEIQNIKDDILLNREVKPANIATADISFLIALKLLEKYHNWLHQ